MSWTEPGGARRDEVAVLENLSVAGVGLFAGVPVEQDSRIEIASGRACLTGFVRRCGFRENGYVVVASRVYYKDCGVILEADATITE